MSMSMQNWQNVESTRAVAKPKQAAGPMDYLAVLVILAAIATLMTIFCTMGSAH
jgi:hypothetical protein